jgi:AcrR family transcriptional regulator
MRLEMASEKKQGRPRDERARRCVLDAVREQLQTGSLCTLSMEGIARQAGVGKQTLYRWWPTLADVALEALVEEAGQNCPVPDTGNVEEDLRTFLRGAFQVIRERSGSLLRCLMVEAQKNPEFRRRFREQFIRSRQDALASLLLRGNPKAEATELLVDMIFGTLWYRLLVGHLPLDDALADQLTAASRVLLSRHFFSPTEELHPSHRQAPTASR